MQGADSKYLYEVHPPMLDKESSIGGIVFAVRPYFFVPDPAYRRENTAWIRVLAALGRIFSFPTLPVGARIRPESVFWLR